MTSIQELIERLEKAEGYDPRDDFEISVHVGDLPQDASYEDTYFDSIGRLMWLAPYGKSYEVFPYTRDIQTALGLLPRGANWILKSEPCGYFATVASFDGEGFCHSASGQTSGKDADPLAALIIAALKLHVPA